jgi:hypothetical protein
MRARVGFPLTISDLWWPWRWEYDYDRHLWTHPVFLGYDALIVTDEILMDSTRFGRLCISLFPSLFWLVVAR